MKPLEDLNAHELTNLYAATYRQQYYLIHELNNRDHTFDEDFDLRKKINDTYHFLDVINNLLRAKV